MMIIEDEAQRKVDGTSVQAYHLLTAEPFLLVPKAIVLRDDLPASAKLVFSLIAESCRRGFKACTEYLFRRSGLARRTIINSIRRLEQAGLVAVIRVGRGRVNRYQIPPWFPMRPFCQIPNRIAERKDLTATAKLAYAVMADRVGDNGFCWPGMRKLAEDIGVTAPTIVPAIRRLEQAGFIRVERRGRGKVNHYRTQTVKEIAPVAPDEQAEANGKRSKNCTTTVKEIAPVVVQKFEQNKRKTKKKDPSSNTTIKISRIFEERITARRRGWIPLPPAEIEKRRQRQKRALLGVC